MLNDIIRHTVAERHLRRTAVQEITGLSRSTIYALMQARTFPRPKQLTGKAVGWSESSIAEWLASRKQAK